MIYLREWREYLGLGRPEVMNQLGHDQATLHKWEDGRSEITVTNLEALAAIYRIPVVWFWIPPPRHV